MRLEATRIDSKSKLFRVPSKPRLTFDVVLPLGNHHGPRPTLAGTHTRREGCNFPLHARRGVNTLGRGPGAFFVRVSVTVLWGSLGRHRAHVCKRLQRRLQCLLST